MEPVRLMSTVDYQLLMLPRLRGLPWGQQQQQHVEVGAISYGEFGDKPVYEYHADIEYTMEAGKQYWVSIYTDLAREQAMNGDLWQWGMGKSLDYGTSESTLFSGGFSYNESLWIQDNAEGPVYKLNAEMDLRLRSDAT
ncbi:MAG: hypothetical protein AB8B55_12680 [Mariniblastus sp.]